MSWGGHVSKAANDSEAAQGPNMSAARELNTSFKRYAPYIQVIKWVYGDEVCRGAI